MRRKPVRSDTDCQGSWTDPCAGGTTPGLPIDASSVHAHPIFLVSMYSCHKDMEAHRRGGEIYLHHSLWHVVHAAELWIPAFRRATPMLGKSMKMILQTMMIYDITVVKIFSF